jgi:hypothetical protein
MIGCLLNDELGKILKKAIVVYQKVGMLYCRLPSGIEEEHEKSQDSGFSG